MPPDDVIVTDSAVVTDSGTVESVALTVRAERRLDVSNVTVTWVGPYDATTLVSGEGASRFDVVPLRDADDSAPVLNDQSDRFRVVLDAPVASRERLARGDEVHLELYTVERDRTLHTVTVPESASQNTTTAGK
jgi:hypothetical protein